jgi:RNA polymerase sigma-70 factor (ECF subfamily)
MNGQPSGNGKGGRFEALCASLRPDLIRFAFWLGRDRQLAEDVVQEALLRAWRSQDRLADPAAMKPWLLTIVRREFARTFERKRLDLVDIDTLIAREEPMLAEAGNQAQKQDIAELRQAILRLEDEYREPLVLQVVMGYSTTEIAAELGLSSAAVLTRLFRARHKLRAMYGEDTSLDPEE